MIPFLQKSFNRSQTINRSCSHPTLGKSCVLSQYWAMKESHQNLRGRIIKQAAIDGGKKLGDFFKTIGPSNITEKKTPHQDIKK